MSCLPHSVAQLRHACAQSAQMARMCSPPLAIDEAASWQTSAHSRSDAMQRAIGWGCASWRQAVAHCKHAAAHSLHARRQASSIWLGMRVLHSINGAMYQSTPRSADCGRPAALSDVGVHRGLLRLGAVSPARTPPWQPPPQWFRGLRWYQRARGGCRGRSRQRPAGQSA